MGFFVSRVYPSCFSVLVRVIIASFVGKMRTCFNLLLHVLYQHLCYSERCLISLRLTSPRSTRWWYSDYAGCQIRAFPEGHQYIFLISIWAFWSPTPASATAAAGHCNLCATPTAASSKSRRRAKKPCPTATTAQATSWP